VYAQRSKQRGESIDLMISLETIGYYSDQPDSQRLLPPLNVVYPNTGNFISFVSNTDNSLWVETITHVFRQEVQFPSEGAALWGWIPGVGWSDHWAFWREGYPAIMVTDTALFRYPHYHTAEDTPDKVNYERLARVVSGLQQVINTIANQSDLTSI
jgi:Zn-dependent M28 family amino/carboxypeptidase